MKSMKVCAIRVKVPGRAAEGHRSPRREAFACDSRIARSVLECASPLALLKTEAKGEGGLVAPK
jgi:hypothetical protein